MSGDDDLMLCPPGVTQSPYHFVSAVRLET